MDARPSASCLRRRCPSRSPTAHAWGGVLQMRGAGTARPGAVQSGVPTWRYEASLNPEPSRRCRVPHAKSGGKARGEAGRPTPSSSPSTKGWFLTTNGGRERAVGPLRSR